VDGDHVPVCNASLPWVFAVVAAQGGLSLGPN